MEHDQAENKPVIDIKVGNAEIKIQNNTAVALIFIGTGFLAVLTPKTTRTLEPIIKNVIESLKASAERKLCVA